MQLALPVRLPDEASFANFLAHAGVAAARAGLCAGLERGGLGALLHGPLGSGRTHLLQACCHELEARGAAIVYLPLAELAEAPAGELLEGLEDSALVCLDDLDAVVGRPDWEEALFHLYNRVQARGGSLLLAAAAPPAGLAIDLADLRSRLSQLLVLALAPADEDALAEALMLRARNRGLQLDAEVARYILQRAPRRMDELVALLDRLDTDSLAAGRRLSLPFVRQTLDW